MLTNGWGIYLGDTFALYSGILICDEASIDEDGKPELYGKEWTYNDDFISIIEVILRDGQIVLSQQV